MMKKSLSSPKQQDRVPAQAMRRFLLITPVVLLSIDGFFSFNDRYTSLYGSYSDEYSIKTLIQIFGILVVFVASLIISKMRVPNPFHHPVFRFYALYLLACIPSVVLSPHLLPSIGAWGMAALQFLALTILVAPSTNRNISLSAREEFLNSWCRACMHFLQLFTLVSLVSYISSPAYQMGEFLITTNRFAGGTWFYWAPNLLTEFAAVVAAVRLRLLFLNSKNFGSNIFWVMVGLVVMIESHSRVSIAAFCVMLIFLFGVATRNYLMKAAFILASFIVLAVSAVFSTSVVDFLSRGQTGEQLLTATGRIETYVAAWQVATENFQTVMIGVGYYVGGRMVVPDFLGRQGLSTVDQTFLEVFVNSGMWALIALVIFFFKIYSRISLAFRIQTAERLLIGCLAISLIFRSMTGPTLHEYGFHLFFAVLITSAVLVWSEGGRANS